MAKKEGLGLQDPPWVNTWLAPPGDHDTYPSHSPVLLTPTNAGNFMEVTARPGRRLTARLSAASPPFVMIPPATGTSFPLDFGYSDSKHGATTPHQTMGCTLTPWVLWQLRGTLTRSEMSAQQHLSAYRPFWTTRLSQSLALHPHTVTTTLRCNFDSYSARARG